jgi:hypothetical protein
MQHFVSGIDNLLQKMNITPIKTNNPYANKMYQNKENESDKTEN